VVIAVLLVVLIVVMAIGWGDPEAAPTSLPTPVAVESTTTTTSPGTISLSPTTSTSTSTTTSSSTSTTTTTLPPLACPGAGAGPMEMGGNFSVLLTAGDFDGDGAEDRFLPYKDPAGAIRARVELSYGYAAELTDPVWGVRLTGALAVSLGGSADLAVAETVGHSSDGEATFLRMRGCELEVVRTSDDAEAYFLLGSTWVGLPGVTCRADGITVTSARPEGGGDWQVSSVTYRWDPAAGVFVEDMSAAAILHSPEDDAAIESHAEFNC
jgi:hypothetical protein